MKTRRLPFKIHSDGLIHISPKRLNLYIEEELAKESASNAEFLYAVYTKQPDSQMTRGARQLKRAVLDLVKRGKLK